MTIEEEQEFLSQWIDKATIGGVLTVLPIHEALVNRLGRNVPLSTTYRLRDIRPPSLARHNWRKVEPDEGGRMSPTKHPKSNPGLQDEFKKFSETVETACVKAEKLLMRQALTVCFSAMPISFMSNLYPFWRRLSLRL